MQYGQCKCGEHKFWGSGMNPPPCTPCEKCGTIPAGSPTSHPDPIPHEFVGRKVETDEGDKTLSYCRWCLKTKAQLAK